MHQLAPEPFRSHGDVLASPAVPRSSCGESFARVAPDDGTPRPEADARELEAETTAHSFEDAFDAFGSEVTSRAGGKKGMVWKQMRSTGKGPSSSFPWRSSTSSTTEMGWRPDLATASQLGREYSQHGMPDDEPDPAWFRRTQPPFGDDERQEWHEDHPRPHERDNLFDDIPSPRP